MKIPSYILAAALLASCVNARGPSFRAAENVRPGDAVIYVYRDEAFAAGARPAYFYVDSVNVFNLNTGGYSWVAIPPGNYKLRQEWSWDMLKKPIELSFIARPGETKYISLKTNMCAPPTYPACVEVQLREEPTETGLSEVQTKAFEDNFGLARLQVVAGQKK